MKIGMNLRGPDKAQEDCKHSNLLIDIPGWAAGPATAPAEVLEGSFVPADFTAPGATPSVPCFTHPATWGWVANGDHVIRAGGKGTVNFGANFDFTGAPGESHAWPIPPPWTSAEASFTIVKVDPTDPLTDLRMIGPLGDDTSFFTPSYLESLRGIDVLRTMDFINSTWNPYDVPPDGPMGRGNEISAWGQVDPRPGCGARGACDLVLALEKVHGKAPDVWVNIPYRCAVGTSATSAAVASDHPEALGAYLRSRLPADVNVYVEYADEMWNYSLYNNYLVQQFSGYGTGVLRYAGYGMLSAACWEAFERGFGRPCVRFLNGQYVWPENNVVIALDALKALGKRVDAIGSAPYWWMGDNYGPTLVAPVKAAWAAGDHAGAITQLIALLHNGIADAVKHLPNWQAIAKQYGVRNVCYEGGTGPDDGILHDPDLNATWEAAQEDPRLATELGNYLTAASPYVDLLCWFQNCGTEPWGAARNAGDWDNARVTGIRAYMGLKPVGASAPYPGDGFGSTGAGLVATPPPTAPAITWSAPAPGVYGTPLSSAQLGATADVPGRFLFTPPAGTLLDVGTGHPLRATFIPDDLVRHKIATASATLEVVPGPDPSGGASFVRQDTVTQGSWFGVYGADGYIIEGSPARLPAYATVTMSPGILTYAWAASTADPRALQVPGGPGRAATTWYVSPAPGFTLDVAITDGHEHILALYFLDWDNAGRVQTVQVKDRHNGAIYDARTISAFGGGLYLAYKVGGRVTIAISRTAGPNTVLGGLFFDTPTPPTPQPQPTPQSVAGWSGTITVKDGRIEGITPA